MNLTTGELVDQPQNEFANAGAIFLMNRGNLETWDFIESQWPGYRGYERSAGRILRIFRLTPI